MKRLLRIVLMLLLVVAGVAGAAAAWLVGSESGSRWVLRQALARLPAGIVVEAGRIDGRLLDRLTIQDLRVEVDGTRFDASRVHLDWRPFGLMLGRLRLVNFELDHPYLRIAPPSGEPSGPWQGTALPIRLDVARMAVSGGRVEFGSERIEIPAASLRARWHGYALRLHDFAIDLARSPDLQLGLHADGRMRLIPSLPLDITLRWRGQFPEVGKAHGSGTLRGDLDRIDILHRFDAPLAMNLHGSVAPSPSLRFDLALDWERFVWPLAGDDVTVALASGGLMLDGNPADYRLRLLTAIASPAAAAGQLRLTAQGDARGLQPVEVDWSAPGGKVNGRGALVWSGDPGVTAKIVARGIDPSHWRPELTGLLDADLAADLQFGGDGPAGRVAIERLSGRLADQPVSGSARLALAGRQLRVESMVVNNGSNHIDMQGTVGEVLAIAGSARIAGLDQYLAGASGALDADWSLTGRVTDPQLQARLHGEGLGWGEFQVTTVSAEVAWPGLASPDPIAVRLALQGLETGAMAFDELTLAASGAMDDQRIDLQASGPQLALAASASGGLIGNGWQGTLERLRVTPATPPGDWTLREAVPVEIAATAARLRRPLCLQQQAASACTEFAWSSVDGVALASRITDLPLRAAAPLLPPDWQVDGLAQINARLTGQGALTGELDLTVAEAVLATPLREAEPLRLEDLALRGRMAPDRRVSVEAALAIVGHGTLDARVAATPTEQGSRYRLDGRVGGRLDDLSALAAVTDAVALRDGRLDINLGIGGDSERPAVSGGAGLSGLLAGVPALGTEFTDIAANIRAVGTNRIALEGSMTAGSGRLSFDGALTLDEATGFPLQMRLGGADALVVRLPEAEVSITPDLQISASARQGVDIRGDLLIPRARISVEELPADVAKVSPDQRLVGEPDEAAPEPEPGRVDVEARIRLGDDVRLEGFGLKTRLTGALSLRSKPEAAPQGFGEIVLVDGSYRAYGQDLTIDTGRLIFAGPIEDPGISLKAFRRSTDNQVTAWLEVSELASAPRLRVYAEPEMAETEALAYLLTGKGLAQSGGADQSRIYAAALNWGVGQGEPLLTRLQDELGLSTLAFEGGEALEQSGVQIGKYLNPDLYLGYGLGLFGRSSELLLRYHVNDYITVESRSGDTQSADVFYQIERD